MNAGLCNGPEEWLFSSAHPSRTVDVLDSWTDLRKSAFAQIRSRGELPHLYKDAVTYFVTFRLLDAVRLKGK